MTKPKPIIAATVVLYHPTKSDLTNIDTYLDNVDKLYVIDNTENHDNRDKLPKSLKIKYFWNHDNLGVAAALNQAARLAIADGYKWLLTNDQDTAFSNAVIDGLKQDVQNNHDPKVAIITPWHHTKLVDLKPQTKFDFPHDVMTSGNLINLAIWQKLGGFKDWLFIDGVDIEYCLNLRAHGYYILRDNELEIQHNLGDLFYKKIFHRVFLCTQHPPIRRYYLMRNAHYLFDIYKDTSEALYCIRLGAAQKYNMLGVLLFENHKFAKIKMYLKGYSDYKKGIKGKLSSHTKFI